MGRVKGGGDGGFGFRAAGVAALAAAFAAAGEGRLVVRSFHIKSDDSRQPLATVRIKGVACPCRPAVRFRNRLPDAD